MSDIRIEQQFDVRNKKMLVVQRLDPETFAIDLRFVDEDGNSVMVRMTCEQLEEVRRELAPKTPPDEFRKKVAKAVESPESKTTTAILFGIIVAQIIALGYILFFI